MKISPSIVQQAIAKTFNVPIDKVLLTTTFDEFNADSFDMINLIWEVEEALAIEVVGAATPTDTSMTVAQYVTAIENYCETMPA